MNTKNAVVTAVAVAAIAGGAAVAVPAFAADNSTPSSSATSGTDTQKDTTRTNPFTESLSGLVDKGTITQDQADAITSSLQAQRAEKGERGGPGGHGGRGGMMRGAGGAETMAAAAKALNLSETDLQTKLQTQTLGEVADAAGVKRTDLVAAMKAAAVKEFESTIDERLTESLDRQARGKGDSSTGSSSNGGSSSSPSASSTPSSSSTSATGA